MVKKTKLFVLSKFRSHRGSTLASLKIGEILAIRNENLASFRNWGSHLLYRPYLLTGLLLMQTKLGLVRPSFSMHDQLRRVIHDFQK